MDIIWFYPSICCLHFHSILPRDRNNQSMTSQDVVQFAPGLAGSQLKELRLDGNSLENTGVTALALHIHDCPLRSLDLSKNRITDVGVGALANALPASKLQVLDLSSQFIGDQGAGALAKALLKGSQLYDLRLHGNDVHLAGATSLAAALSTGVPLKRLSLTINLPSNGALEALANALPKSQLLSLELKIVSVECGGVASLARLGRVF